MSDVAGLSLKARISQALAAEGLKPLHRLGQNFMIEEKAVAAMVEAAGPGLGVRCVEIGPGTGVLTERLLAAGSQVLAVELDAGLHRLLTRTLVPAGLELVHGDALATKNRLHPAIEAFAALGPWRLASNLPYDVALPVILNAVALPQPPAVVAVTIQREAAERLVSRPGDDAWGATAAVLQAAGSPKIVRHLSPGCFFPAPRVESSILRWTPQRILPPGFGTWCREVFAYRRKVIPGALRDAGATREAGEAACAALGVDPLRRLESLDSLELVALFTQITTAGKDIMNQVIVRRSPSGAGVRRQPLLVGIVLIGLGCFSGLVQLSAAESPAIASIDGKPLTLRELENTLLRREGADLVEEWVHNQLESLDFAKLQDDDVILAIGFNKITRREIADSLLRKGVGKIRDELINIRIVEQAVAEAKITVGQDQLDATWERMRKRFEDGQAKSGETRIDFVNYLSVKEKMTPEQFRAQSGFKMLAGLQALVHSLAQGEWKDDDLRVWFDSNRERYRVIEGIDLNLIALPYRKQPGPDGKPVVTAEEREGRMLAATQLYDQIKSKQLTFAKAWTFYAKGFDPDVKEGGHAGFVDRDGRRDGATERTRTLGSDLVQTAFGYRLKPMLLPPMACEWGVELAEVLGYRRAAEPTFEEVRGRVLADRIDETLEARTQGLLTTLRAKAKIEYVSLPDVIGGQR